MLVVKHLVLALALLAACSKKSDPGPTCAQLTDHALELIKKTYPGHGEMQLGNRDRLIQECEARNYTPKQRKCLLAAQSLDAAAACAPAPETERPATLAPTAPKP